MKFNLIGSYGKAFITDNLIVESDKLFKQYEDHFVFQFKVSRETAKHIVRTYGTTGLRVMELGQELGMLKRLSESSPFIQAEVVYAIRNEMA